MRTLTDPKACRILATFIGRERTLSQAAADLDLSLSALTYWVGRLIAAGLLTVARRERRRGSPIKRYRATADAFFVPNAALIEHGRASFRAELRSELQAALTRSLAYADGADAKALQRELTELLERYRGRGGGRPVWCAAPWRRCRPATAPVTGSDTPARRQRSHGAARGVSSVEAWTRRAGGWPGAGGSSN